MTECNWHSLNANEMGEQSVFGGVKKCIRDRIVMGGPKELCGLMAAGDYLKKKII